MNTDCFDCACSLRLDLSALQQNRQGASAGSIFLRTQDGSLHTLGAFWLLLVLLRQHRRHGLADRGPGLLLLSRPQRLPLDKLGQGT